MNTKKLPGVLAEMARMQAALKAWDARKNEHGTKEAGAVRRASLDLSRALTELRRAEDYS